MTGLSQPKVGAGDDDDALLILDLPVDRSSEQQPLTWKSSGLKFDVQENQIHRK